MNTSPFMCMCFIEVNIIKAENIGNLTVYLTFSDNTTQTVDIGDQPILHIR